MPYAKNPLDASGIYFEDDGGTGAPVVLHGGFLDSVATVRDLDLAQALRDEFRLINVDHRGLGRSNKPHEPDAYAMSLRVADAVAVLDELGIESAHFIGMSWGGRLGFVIGEHAPMEALIQAMEAFWKIRFPEALRARYLDNDPAALKAAWTKALAEGAVARDLRIWGVRCLILMGAGDTDFLEQAQRASTEIPNAEFLSLAGRDHIAAHMGQGDPVIEAVLRMLRAESS